MNTSIKPALRRILSFAAAWMLLTAASVAHSDQKDWPRFWEQTADSDVRATLDAAFTEFAKESAEKKVNESPEKKLAYERAIPPLERLLEANPAEDKAEQLKVGRAWMFLGELYYGLSSYEQSFAAEEKGLALIDAASEPYSLELAETLQSHAYTYNLLDRDAESLPLYQRSLEIRERMQGPEALDVADGLLALADVYLKLERFSEALPLLKRSVAIREKVGGQGLYLANDLSVLARVYVELGQNAEALRLIRRSAAILRRIEPPTLELATVLGDLAVTHLKLKRPSEALSLLRRAVAIREKASPELDLADALLALAVVHRELRQYAEALPLYERSLAIQEKVLGSEALEVALTLSDLAEIHVKLNQFSEALPLYNRSIVIREKVQPDAPELADALVALASTHVELRRYEDALPFLFRCLEIREKVEPKAEATAVLLDVIGRSYLKMNRFSDALPFFERSVAMSEALSLDLNLAGGLEDWAEALRELGRYSEALALNKRSVAIRQKRQSPESPELASALEYLGRGYLKLGQYSEALPLLRRSLSIREKVLGRDAKDLTIVLLETGVTLFKLERFSEALPYIKRSVAIGEKTGMEDVDLAKLLSVLARTHLELGRFSDAQRLYERSLAILDRVLGPEHPDMVDDLVYLAVVYSRQGLYEKSLGAAYRAEQIAVRSEILEKIAYSQFVLSSVYEVQGKPEISIFWGKQSVNTIQRMRSDLTRLSGDDLGLFWEKKSYAYSDLADKLIAAGRIPEAQRVMAMLKEEEYFDFTSRDAGMDPRRSELPLTGLEREVGERYYAICKNIVQVAREYDALKLRDKRNELTEQEKQRMAVLASDLSEARVVVEEFKGGLSRLMEADDDKRKAVDKRLVQIESHMTLLNTLGDSKKGVAILQYVVSKERLHIILTTSSSPQVVRDVPIERTALNVKINSFLKMVRNPRNDPRPEGRELYDVLIEPMRPIIEASGVQTLVLVLDGTLRLVPFAALMQDDNTYLIEKYDLAIYPEAGSMVALRPQQNWTMAAFGVTRGFPEQNARPLGAVRGELASIAQVLRGQVFLDDLFTFKSFESSLENAENAVVHAATHFLLTGDDKSYLLLGDGSRLSLHDIRIKNLRFDSVELLTFSACETAVSEGSRSNGLEVEGLAALAQQQGAKAVLATLWSVADQSTAIFMEAFYADRERDHLNKAKALQQAQISFLKGSREQLRLASEVRSPNRASNDPDSRLTRYKRDPARPYAHPFYWAPFILMGNWL